MNSFAALIGSLTGAPVSGAAGAPSSGSAGTGLFSGLLEASIAAQPLAGAETGIAVQATLTASDAKPLPGAIELSTLLQASRDTQGGEALLAGELLSGEIAADGVVPLPSGLTGKLDIATDGGMQLDASPEAGPGEDESATATDGIPEGAAQIAIAQLPSTETLASASIGVAATTGGIAVQTTDGETAPDRQSAAPALPGQARTGATLGLAGSPVAKPAAGQPAPNANAGAAQPAGGDAEAQQASKAAHLAANAKTEIDATVRPKTLPGEKDTGNRADLAKQAGISRTLAIAANGQAVVQIVRSGNPDTSPSAGLDQTSGSIHLRAAATAPVQPQGQTPQIPLNTMAVHIAQQASNGARRFDIRLDPPELGRVEVRLDVKRDGHVTAHLVVERSETLDLLQRDARALERALQNAGLDTEGGLKFSLKDQGENQPGARDESQNQTHASREHGNQAGEALEDIDNAIRTGRRYIATGGLDIRI